MKTIQFTLLTCAAALLTSCTTKQEAETSAPELKPRLVVMTDIGPADVEPDDNESAVRLMSYADRFEIEAIITTVGWNCDPYPDDWAEYLNRVVNDYGVDVSNLMKRSGQTEFLPLDIEQNEPQALGYWPSVEYIRSRTMMGSQRAGIGVIGEDNDTPGSQKIIELVDETDDRPIYFCAWGSGNTLAQAIWRVQQERSEEELKAFLHKIRLYTITDQDMVYAMRMQRDYSAHMWLRKEFAEDLMLIWDESAWLNQNSQGSSNWDKYATFIQNHGAMGSHYPHYLWGVEGDTPSFLHCMPNGLNDPSDPTQVGWGGVHQFGLSPDSLTLSWTNWQQPLKDISNAYELRFYPDEFNDFAARMQWAAEGKGTTNPVVIVNGRSSISPLHMTAKVGENLSLDASKSYDPEGDTINYLWWQQPEAGTYQKPLELKETTGEQLTVSIPADASGKSIHMICEVHDNSPFNLVSYQRVIIDVE